MRAIVPALLFLALATPAGAHVGPDATRVTWEAVPCAVACGYWLGNGFTPCASPFPPGSYDDVVTTPAPERPAGKILILEASLDSTVDWDLFMCVGDPPGDREVCATHGDCTTVEEWPPECFVGCHEHAVRPVVPGQRVTLRAYNWLDPAPATGAYWFTAI